MMDPNKNQEENIIEAALMVAGRPLTAHHLQKIFSPAKEISDIHKLLKNLQEKYLHSGLELREVASGFQFQAKQELAPWLAKLWEERPPRYSRAFLETLALIAYKQPITRAEIEEIRGVTTSSHIIKTLLEQEWIHVLGQREVPGRPALYGTTKTFLDHFNLKNLTELPALTELNDLENQEEKLHVQLEFTQSETSSGPSPSIIKITETHE